MTDFRADDQRPKPFRVADRLREAREAAGLQQKDLGALLKWDPAKMSKTESGERTAVSETDVRAWAAATGMSDEDRDETIDLLVRFKSNEKSWREHLRKGRRSIQLDYNRLYQEKTNFRMLQTIWVPGILQTPDYARQIFAGLNEIDPGTPIDLDAEVQVRMARREYLYDLRKRFEFLLTEGVLRSLIVDAPVMRAQLVRLGDVFELPNVRLGVLPQGVRLHTAPQGSFVIYDDLAIIEGFGTQDPYHGAQAERLAGIMDRLWSDAVEGPAALDLIRRATSDLPG